MNIFLRELKANLRSLLIWIVIVTLFVSVAIAKFSAYEGNPEMLKVLDSMPKALLDAFSMQAFNLTTVEGFFGVMFIYYALMLGIAAVLWGSDIISKEERDKTVEFALTLPVTRSRVITAKVFAALVNCIVLWLVTWGISVAMAQQYEPQQSFYEFVSLEMRALLILQLVYLAIGVFLGSAMKRYRLVGSTAISILLATYFISVISGLDERYEFLKYFSPFKYFDASYLFHEGKMDPLFVILSLGIIVVCVVGAYLAYNRRDLYI